MLKLTASAIPLLIGLFVCVYESDAQIVETAETSANGHDVHMDDATHECAPIHIERGVVAGGIAQFNDDEELIRAAMKQATGVNIPSPAYAVSAHYPLGGVRRWTGTLYRDSTLLQFDVSPDGSYAMTTKGIQRPQGLFRIVTVVVNHDNSDPAHGTEMLWLDAQDHVTEMLGAFAEDRGSPDPMVSFSFTNLFIDAGEIPNPENSAFMYGLVEARGISPSEYELLVVLDLDSQKPGEYSIGADCRFVHVDWIFAAEDHAEIDQAKAFALAEAAYGRAVANVWGWNPGWTPSNEAHVLVPWTFDFVDAGLLGWEDTDQDGIVEILDPAPYGITAPPAPTLIAPADSSENVPLESTLSWLSVAGAESYHHLQVFAYPDSEPMYEHFYAESGFFPITQLPPVSRYYWRVRAQRNGEYGFWSETRTFTSTSSWLNYAPYVYRPLNDTTVTVGAEYDLPSIFHDDDWTSFTNTVSSSDDEIVAVRLRGYALNVRALSAGSATIKWTATDPHGASATHSFRVNVEAGVGTGSATSDLPDEFVLRQNYPNPFNPRTVIAFDLPRRSNVTLKLFDVLGKQVAILAFGDYPAGSFQVVWDASGFPSGVYLYRLDAEAYSQTKTLILQR